MLIRMELAWILAVVALTGAGCRSGGGGESRGSSASTRPVKTAVAEAPIPPGSAFAKLRHGMGTNEVSDLIGPPTDEDARVTGKVFNPFYYGTDTHRMTWYYKNEGRLIFSSRGRLLEIHYNADERGYR